eukprot:CAMPEP_0170586306 /NCGR_PEP_ID=MMETSP0224-20130122/9680_1 /TAXON_ID=285029 /ORGANISM="Togula jolla, Strain CCCM 725" /LENGTH=488 /DNA_ID=CAMNT_0010909855 /DNA_START=1 /DNA_END=1467 /DNA_ORIENTATION=+
MSQAADRPKATDEAKEDDADSRRRVFITYLLILIAFLTVQFGHGSNIGVAVSLPGDSKAMNLALGSWVMVGVCLGLPVTPWACRTFGAFRTCSVCVVIDLFVILLMLYPHKSMQQIYAVRFLVGFFEAPLLPYLQEWLAKFGKRSWNVWNTVLHAMVPVGENLGYLVAQELDAMGVSWQWAFFGQALTLGVAIILIAGYGGRRYLDISPNSSHTFVSSEDALMTAPLASSSSTNGDSRKDAEEAFEDERELIEDDPDAGHVVEYPVTEKWAVFWATNASLASQLGFLSGCKYVIRDYAIRHGFNVHTVIFSFSAIALLGPALGGAIAMSGRCIRPDHWTQHRRTLLFLTTVSTVAAVFSLGLLVAPFSLFWPLLLVCFIAAGGVYPAAQGIINIALTESRVIEASVYQVQCNNLLFAMPMPYVIGKSMDCLGVDTSFRCVIMIQVIAAMGFATSVVVSACTEERSTWNRLHGLEMSTRRGDEADEDLE